MDYKENFSGGEPEMNKDDFLRAQDSIQEALNYLLQGLALTTDCIISGCVVTTNGDGSKNVTAGYIYIDSQVVEVEAQNNVADGLGSGFFVYQRQTTYPTEGTKTFLNAVVRQTWRNERGIVTNVASVGSDLSISGVQLQNVIAPDASTTVKGIIEIATNTETETGTSTTRAVPPDGIEHMVGEQLKRKVLEIGDWNMDSTQFITVAHGLAGSDWKNIRSINVVIRNDADTNYYMLNSMNNLIGTSMDGAVSFWTATLVNLMRVASGQFDNTSFDSISYNRGWITIWYID